MTWTVDTVAVFTLHILIYEIHVFDQFLIGEVLVVPKWNEPKQNVHYLDETTHIAQQVDEVIGLITVFIYRLPQKEICAIQILKISGLKSLSSIARVIIGAHHPPRNEGSV